MKMTKDYLENFADECNIEEVFSQVHNFLVQDGVFSVLQDGNCDSFHEKIYELVKYPHGLGVALSVLPIVNVSGLLLYVAKENGSTIASEMLDKIVKGEVIPAVAVSEENWKGKLSKLKTTLTKKDEHFILSGKKSFISNSHSATHFLVVAKENERYKIVIVPKNERGIHITSFSLGFVKELTHAEVSFENVIISSESILPLDYSNWGERAKFNEMFSFAYVLNSYFRVVVHKLIVIASEKEIWKNDFQSRKKTFELFQVLDMHKLYLKTISTESCGKERLTYPLEEKYPFGLSVIIPIFLSFCKNIFSEKTLFELFPDLQILSFNTIEQDYSFKKIVRSFYQHIFQTTAERFVIEI